MSDLVSSAPPRTATPAEVLQGALVDSRQRWRELIGLATDFAFETDDRDCFTLIAPDPALGWPAASLIGQPAIRLLAMTDGAGFNPFRITAGVRHRQAWIKRGDGGTACLSFSAAPVLDNSNRIVGVRGVGVDMTALDDQMAEITAALRRSQVTEHILRRIAREVLSPRMIGAALDGIRDGMGAEGAAVLNTSAAAENAQYSYVVGTGAEAVRDTAAIGLREAQTDAATAASPDGRAILFAACQPRSGERAGLVAWRQPGARAWDNDDFLLIGSAVKIVLMLLERDAIQSEMIEQARTDPLTGLLNRRAFLEDIERHLVRQERDNQQATLMFVDLDHFKPVNDHLGHEAGDEVLRRTAALLRKTFRPADLVARLGGDEFAIWMPGADHMTAAERAEYLRDAVPEGLFEITGPDLPRVGVSIGIACRDPGGGETLDQVMRRADHAMYEVKRGGRGHWRVSLLKQPE